MRLASVMQRVQPPQQGDLFADRNASTGYISLVNAEGKITEKSIWKSYNSTIDKSTNRRHEARVREFINEVETFLKEQKIKGKALFLFALKRLSWAYLSLSNSEKSIYYLDVIKLVRSVLSCGNNEKLIALARIVGKENEIRKSLDLHRSLVALTLWVISEAFAKSVELPKQIS